MRRRTVLALVATSTTGCLRFSGSSSEQTSRFGGTKTPTQTVLQTLTAGNYRVAVTDVTVRPSVFAASDADTHTGVIDEPDTQYVVVALDNRGAGSVSDLPLTVVADGEPLADTFHEIEPGLSNRLAFPIPVAEVQRTRRTVLELSADESTDRWPLPEAQVSKLGHAAEFTTTNFSVPDSVQYGHRFEVSFTVRNTGDREGRFLAELWPRRNLEIQQLRLQIPAAATKTETTILDPSWDSHSDELPIVLDWGTDQRRATVAVEGTSTPPPDQ